MSAGLRECARGGRRGATPGVPGMAPPAPRRLMLVIPVRLVPVAPAAGLLAAAPLAPVPPPSRRSAGYRRRPGPRARRGARGHGRPGGRPCPRAGWSPAHPVSRHVGAPVTCWRIAQRHEPLPWLARPERQTAGYLTSRLERGSGRKKLIMKRRRQARLDRYVSVSGSARYRTGYPFRRTDSRTCRLAVSAAPAWPNTVIFRSRRDGCLA
jgi:hypothetical protein